MECSYPGKDARPWLRCTGTVLWFIQTVYLPACVCIEICKLFAHNATPLDILMNALAVTFIVEADEMLYSAVLTDSQKASYQMLSSRRDRTHERRLFLGWARFGIMILAYFLFRHFRNEGRETYN